MYPSKLFTLTSGVFTLTSGYPSKFWHIPVVYPGNFLTYPRCVSKQAFGLSQLCIQASFWRILVVYPSKFLTLTDGVFTLTSGYPSKFWLIPAVYPGNFLTYPRCVSKQAFGLSQLCIQASFWLILSCVSKQVFYFNRWCIYFNQWVSKQVLAYPSSVSK